MFMVAALQFFTNVHIDLQFKDRMRETCSGGEK
jgi:hypothetical protein